MERDTQKSKCGLESTGTTYNLILIVLSSAFFLFPEYYVIGLVSIISSLLLGKRIRIFLLLAIAIFVHEMTVIFAFISENTIVFRFCSLVAVLLVGCLILMPENETIAIGLATTVITIAIIPAIAVLLELGSVVSCVGVIYTYLLLLSNIFGLFFLALLIQGLLTAPLKHIWVLSLTFPAVMPVFGVLCIAAGYITRKNDTFFATFSAVNGVALVALTAVIYTVFFCWHIG